MFDFILSSEETTRLFMVSSDRGHAPSQNLPSIRAYQRGKGRVVVNQKLFEQGSRILPGWIGSCRVGSIRGQGGSGWGGDWFGSDPLSKRVLHFRPDPCQNRFLFPGPPVNININ